MTLLELYQNAQTYLGENIRDSQLFDLSCLLEDMFGVQRQALSILGVRQVEEQKAACFMEYVCRYAKGEPLQYLLGEWEFYGLPFQVGPGVLIPRPDTEALVDVALTLLKDKKAPVVADLCSGSGCIAISIAHHCPGAQVFALELSKNAFPYLMENIRRNHSNVTALNQDVMCPPQNLPPLDLVVSNPPYISRVEMGGLETQVRHEPEMALYGGEDGYDFYRALPSLYWPLLRQGATILFETGWRQAHGVAELLRIAGYQDVSISKDLCGMERVVIGKKCCGKISL